MKYFSALLSSILFVVASNPVLACLPMPPPKSNWLRFKIKLDEATFSQGLSAKSDDAIILFNFGKRSKALYRNPDWPKDSSIEWVALPESAHLSNITRVELIEGSLPSFTPIDAGRSIPSAQPFEIHISLNEKLHTLKGKVVYSRNPSYDPQALEKWEDPCSSWYENSITDPNLKKGSRTVRRQKVPGS